MCIRDRIQALRKNRRSRRGCVVRREKHSRASVPPRSCLLYTSMSAMLFRIFTRNAVEESAVFPMLVKRSHMLCGMIYGRNGIESIPHMKTYMLLRPQIIMKRNAAAIRPSHDPRLHVNIRQTPIAATLISETALPRSPLTKVSINAVSYTHLAR